MTFGVILWLASLAMMWSITVVDLAVTRVGSVMRDTTLFIAGNCIQIFFSEGFILSVDINISENIEDIVMFC